MTNDLADSTERIPIENHQHFIDLRAPLITASAVPIVCGEATYSTAAVYFAEKTGLRPPQLDSPVLRRGRWGEASAFEAAAEELPDRAFTRAKVFFRNTEIGLGATPDGFETAPGRPGIGVVQTKVIARARFRETFLVDPSGPISGEAEPPAAFMLQTLTEMMLSGANRGLLVVLIVGEFTWDFRAFEIERNEELEGHIVRKVGEFWDKYLLPNVMPSLDFGRDQELVRALHPKDDGSEIDLTGDNRAAVLVEDLTQIQAAKKRLVDEEEKIKTELEAKLGIHAYGRLADGRRISWKLQKRKAYPVAAGEFRVFRILKPNTQSEAAA